MTRTPPRFPLPFAAHQFSCAAGARNDVACIGMISQIKCERLDAFHSDQF
jgi:hypothetical protein